MRLTLSSLLTAVAVTILVLASVGCNTVNPTNSKGVTQSQNQAETPRDSVTDKLLGNGAMYSGTIVRTDGGFWYPNGEAKLLFPDGTLYKGSIVAGWRHGQGIMQWPGGRKYVGRFKEGKFDGFGKLTCSNGQTRSGLWRADKFVTLLSPKQQ